MFTPRSASSSHPVHRPAEGVPVSLLPIFLTLALLSGCALYSDVDVSPLLLEPGDTFPTVTTIESLTEIGEYTKAIAAANSLVAKRMLNERELASLGRAELASARYGEARRHLRAALDFKPYRTEAAAIAWDLSQVEYMSNNYSAALEWAKFAMNNGLGVRQWHISYLEALSNVNVYHVEGPTLAKLKMRDSKPAIPRVEVTVNDSRPVTAVIDTGAALSIVSERFAKSAGIRTLGDFKGTFFGLLGEPIDVTFGILDTLVIGDMHIRSVPVAIMPESKMEFLVANREHFDIDMLLGTNLLKEFAIDFDFPDDTVTFRSLPESERTPSDQQNLFMISSRPLVQSTINKRGWYLFVVDSGSEVTFLNETEISNTNLRNFPKLYGARLQGLGGSFKRGSKLENIQIGVDKWAGTFKHLPLYSTEKTRTLGILGANFIQNFRVEMDFGTMRLNLIRERRLLR